MIRELRRLVYFIYFCIAKHLKYPTCRIRSNFILPGVQLGRHVWIERSVKVYPGVSIGDYTFINENTRLDPATGRIGKFCSISHDVKIGLGPHPLSFFTTSPAGYSPQRGIVREWLYDEAAAKKPVQIGNDVFIAANAIVLAGTTIGDGAVIAAGSVVTRDVPPYAVVAGIPAAIVRYRFDPVTIERLLRLKWWDMDERTIAKHASLGFSIDQFIDAMQSERRSGR